MFVEHCNLEDLKGTASTAVIKKISLLLLFFNVSFFFIRFFLFCYQLVLSYFGIVIPESMT
uniref:Uncharacterized protein n=1 Tax=Anguilla anguilla TaxID=7936 RepID=A0A0E9Q8A3_ANGAN